MKRVVVSGYYGFGNLGDEALLRSIVYGLRRRVPDLDIVVASADPEGTARMHGVKAVGRADPGVWWSVLGGADLLISGGGSLFQDVTGPLNIPYYAGVMALAYARGVPVMVFAQGIGPIRGRLGRQMVRWAMNRAAAVTVRDGNSRELLLQLGVTRPIEVVADPVLTLVPDVRSLGEGRAPRGPSAAGGRLNVGVALRRRGLPDGMVERIATALDCVAQRHPLQYTFFPMQRDEDLGVATAVAARLRAPHRVVTEVLDLDGVMRLIARCDFVIAMRLHALILAAMLGRPVAGISYDPKVEEFLGQVEGVLLAVLPDLPPASTLASRIEQALQRRALFHDTLRDRVGRLRQRAERSFELAATLLGAS